MGKRGRILIAVVAIIVTGVVGGTIFREWSAPREPMYQGMPLSYWLQGYANYMQSTNLPGYVEANMAVHKIGADAIPTLLQMLDAPNAPRNTTLWRWAFSIPYVRHHYIFSGPKNIQAFEAFNVLGRDAAPAVPGLVKILNENSNSNAMVYSAVILGGIGPAAADAVPALLRAAAGTNQNVRSTALFALGQIQCEPGTVVPVLVHALHDPSAEIRASAVNGLASFKANARSADPALVEIISEPDGGSNSVPAYRMPPASLNPSVRSLAKGALQMIDPETYAKGVTNTAPIRSP